MKEGIPALGSGLSIWEMGAMTLVDRKRQSQALSKKLARWGCELVQCIKIFAARLDELSSIPGTPL